MRHDVVQKSHATNSGDPSRRHREVGNETTQRDAALESITRGSATSIRYQKKNLNGGKALLLRRRLTLCRTRVCSGVAWPSLASSCSDLSPAKSTTFSSYLSALLMLAMPLSSPSPNEVHEIGDQNGRRKSSLLQSWRVGHGNAQCDAARKSQTRQWDFCRTQRHNTPPLLHPCPAQSPTRS